MKRLTRCWMRRRRLREGTLVKIMGATMIVIRNFVLWQRKLWRGMQRRSLRLGP